MLSCAVCVFAMCHSYRKIYRIYACAQLCMISCGRTALTELLSLLSQQPQYKQYTCKEKILQKVF